VVYTQNRETFGLDLLSDPWALKTHKAQGLKNKVSRGEVKNERRGEILFVDDKGRDLPCDGGPIKRHDPGDDG
jgi:hypothetical protein